MCCMATLFFIVDVNKALYINILAISNLMKLIKLLGYYSTITMAKYVCCRIVDDEIMANFMYLIKVNVC